MLIAEASVELAEYSPLQVKMRALLAVVAGEVWVQQMVASPLDWRCRWHLGAAARDAAGDYDRARTHAPFLALEAARVSVASGSLFWQQLRKSLTAPVRSPRLTYSKSFHGSTPPGSRC